MVTKLEGISSKGWSDIVEKEYGKHHYPNDSQKYEYTRLQIQSSDEEGKASLEMP
jgi:hypothetical protein